MSNPSLARASASLAALMLLCSASASRADVDLWPLFESSDRGTTVLYPFYVHEGNFLMVFPLFYRTHEGKDYHFVWPMVKVASGRLARLTPIWFSGDEGSFVLFPLIRQTPESTLWTVPPLYIKRDGSFFAIFPLFAKSSKTWFAFPSFYRSTDGGSLFMFLPFFARSQRVESKTLWILPYYQERGPKTSKTMVFPLFDHERNDEDESSSLWLLPFSRHRSKTRSKTALYPFFSAERAQDPRREETESNWTVLWPLYRRESRYSKDDQLVRLYRRFLIFADKWEQNGKRSFSIFGFPIVEREG